MYKRQEIAECANEATEVIGGILDSIQEKENIYRVSGSPSAFDMDCLLYTYTNFSNTTGGVNLTNARDGS